jgi:hypothetical protein
VHPRRCSFLGVTQLQSRVALIMKYYPLGSLAQQLERGWGCGLPLEQALRWVGAAGGFVVRGGMGGNATATALADALPVRSSLTALLQTSWLGWTSSTVRA